MSDNKTKLQYFTIEIRNSKKYTPEQAIAFFDKKSINIVKHEVDQTTDHAVIYKLFFNYSVEIIMGIDLMRSENLYEKEEFKILKINITNDFADICNKKKEELKSSKLITYPTEYENNITKNFVKQVGAEGLEFVNKQILEKQRTVLSYMIKSLGSNMFSGKSINNLSLPIYIFDHRSQTEILPYNHRMNHFLEKAADSSNIERMKLCITNFVATMNFNLSAAKPFNPILGETFQAKIGNSICYCEQTSHHPPITNFYIVNPKFKSYGYIGMEATMNPNKMIAINTGSFMFEFVDGNKYKIYPPNFMIMGLAVGRRFINFTGAMKIEDLTNNMIGYVNINPDTRSFFGKLFSKDIFPDYILGFIANKDDVKTDKKTGVMTCDDKYKLCKIEGEWTRYINFNEICYWRQDEQTIIPMERDSFVLESDAQYREDLMLFKMGMEDQAQEAKIYLETQQRKDKVLRDDYNKANKIPTK